MLFKRFLPSEIRTYSCIFGLDMVLFQTMPDLSTKQENSASFISSRRRLHMRMNKRGQSENLSNLSYRVPFAEGFGLKAYILDLTDIHDVRKVWKYLENQIEDVSTTNLWAWVSTWITNYHSLTDIKFVALFKDDLPCGITVISCETKRRIPFPVRAFHVGTNGEPYSDQVKMVHNKILVDEKYIFHFLHTLKNVLTFLNAEEIIFNDFDETQAKFIAQVFGDKNISIKNESCRALNLEVARKNGLGILGNLSHDTRYSIKRSLKAFGNDITVEWAENSHQALDILDELIAFYRKRWEGRGITIMFDSPYFAAFQRDVVQNLFETGKIVMFRVKSRSYGTLGCLYMISDNGVAYGYQAGFNDFENVDFGTINKKRLRTGFIVHTLCMEEALRRGIKEYNFSYGEYSYKKELTNTQSTLTTISVKNGVKPKIREQIMETYQKINNSDRASFLLKPLKLILM